MKTTLLKSPKLYIWMVLILLPIQATLFTQIRNIDMWKGVTIFQRRAAAFESAMLTGDTLSQILFGLIAISIALLLLALSLIEPKSTPSIHGVPGGPKASAGRGQ